MKKLLGIGLGLIGATLVASIYTIIKEEKEQKLRAAKTLDEKRKIEEENRINEAFRRMTQEIKNTHDDIVRRMERDSNI